MTRSWPSLLAGTEYDLQSANWAAILSSMDRRLDQYLIDVQSCFFEGAHRMSYGTALKAAIALVISWLSVMGGCDTDSVWSNDTEF